MVKTITARQSVELSPAQIESALVKLRRRVSELDAFQPTGKQDVDSVEALALRNKIDATLGDVFGLESAEYQRYRVASLWGGAISFGRGPTPREVSESYRAGVAKARARLSSAIDSLEERLGDLSVDATAPTLRAFEGLTLHPEIERAAGQLYRNGHYANAVEDACKALNLLVKLRSGRDDLDGKGLMTTVFSKNAPILRFNDLSDQSDLDEQEGMMHLFAGVMAGFRNPRAHKFIEDDPERALECIAFASLLAKLLDGAERA